MLNLGKQTADMMARAGACLRTAATLCALALAGFLAGCGGGGGGGSAVSVEPLQYDSEAQWGLESGFGARANLLHWTSCSANSNLTCANSSQYVRGAGVTIAIVDDGVDLDHVDLAANIVTTALLPLTLQANYGILTITLEGIPITTEVATHGTHVAGIAAAAINSIGMVGVAPEAKILPLNFIDNQGSVQGNILATMYDAAVANNAFVANNSWGPGGGQWVKVSVGAGAWRDTDADAVADGFHWVLAPNTFRDASVNSGILTLTAENYHNHLTSVGTDSFGDPILEPYYEPIVEAARDHGMLIVFAQGNGGWNSLTGEVPACAEENFTISLGICGPTDDVEEWLQDSVTLDLSQSDLNDMPIFGVEGFGRTVTAAAGLNNIWFDEDYAGFQSRIPLDVTLFGNTSGGSWLNVVATDANGEMAFFSDACGETKWFCLAAPGVGILSTVPDDETAVYSGTSMSAPHVTGAAALLKGAFPNLTAAQVATILLDSADGMGTCATVSSQISCADDSYGHGILNLSAAFTPLTVSLASGTGGQVASLSESRIVLSPAFGAAPWRHTQFMAGSLDNFGRVFYTHIDLANGAYVLQPLANSAGEIDGAGVHSAHAAPAQMAAAAGEDLSGAANMLAATDWRHADQHAAYGARSHGAAQSRFMMANFGGASAGWGHRAGYQRWRPRATEDFWQAPFDSGEAHQALLAFNAGGAGVVGKASGGWRAPQMALLASASDDILQQAARLQWQGADWRLQAEGGVVRENGKMLGASFYGAYAVQDTRTAYARLAGFYDIGAARVFGDYWQGDARATGAGGLLQGARAHTDEWAAGLQLGDWTLTAAQEMSIRRGNLDLAFISGYTPDGDYATGKLRLPLAAGRRPGRLSVARQFTGKNLRAAISADYLHNAPSRNYQDDAIAFSAALRYNF